MIGLTSKPEPKTGRSDPPGIGPVGIPAENANVIYDPEVLRGIRLFFERLAPAL